VPLLLLLPLPQVYSISWSLNSDLWRSHSMLWQDPRFSLSLLLLPTACCIPDVVLKFGGRHLTHYWSFFARPPVSVNALKYQLQREFKQRQTGLQSSKEAGGWFATKVAVVSSVGVKRSRVPIRFRDSVDEGIAPDSRGPQNQQQRRIDADAMHHSHRIMPPRLSSTLSAAVALDSAESHGDNFKSPSARLERARSLPSGMIMGGGLGREGDHDSNVRDTEMTFGDDYALLEATRQKAEQRKQRQRVQP
jgi:hypothetical protein